ncbi:hypothetical protein QFW85_00020 (plasmid) [Vibrio chagasii]|uniref:hypothetical protein n=1 Tax=Vibrio chagasii TaxID=170679 RepID=UPI003DA97401
MNNKRQLFTVTLIAAIAILGYKLQSSHERDLEELCIEFSDIGWIATKNGGVRQGKTKTYMVNAAFFAYPDGEWSFNVVTSNNSCSEDDNHLIFEDQKIKTTNMCEPLNNGLQINRIYPKTKKAQSFFSQRYTPNLAPIV